MEQIRVGLIGAGGNTKSRHIPEFNKIKGIQLLSVANQSTQSSEQVAKEFNIAETARNWRVLLEGRSN
jgi:predicted dehydrogenase